MAEVRTENINKQRGETEQGNIINESLINELCEHLKGKPGKSKLISGVEAWDDLRLSGTALGKAASAAPVLGAFLSSGGLKVYRFEAAKDESVYFEIQLPHAWKEGSTIHPHVHWTPTSTDTKTVIWGLEYSWSNIDDISPTATTITVTTNSSGVAWKHQLVEMPDIIGKDKKYSSMLVGRFYRSGTTDTYTGDAALLELDFHYIINSLGSIEEYKSAK